MNNGELQEQLAAMLWVDRTSYKQTETTRIPQVYTMQLPGLLGLIRVHRVHHLEGWFVSAVFLGWNNKELTNVPAREHIAIACQNALVLVVSELRELGFIMRDTFHHINDILERCL